MSSGRTTRFAGLRVVTLVGALATDSSGHVVPGDDRCGARVFNLIPGFPLDGGRLLRSLVWRATGSFRRATRIASLAGQAAGWLLVAGGVAFLLTGNLAGGIWFAFIGWFLVQAARASYTELQVRQMLRGVQAQDVMADNLVRIPPEGRY
jgi:hypothetical protein